MRREAQGLRTCASGERRGGSRQHAARLLRKKYEIVKK